MTPSSNDKKDSGLFGRRRFLSLLGASVVAISGTPLRVGAQEITNLHRGQLGEGWANWADLNTWSYIRYVLFCMGVEADLGSIRYAGDQVVDVQNRTNRGVLHMTGHFHPESAMPTATSPADMPPPYSETRYDPENQVYVSVILGAQEEETDHRPSCGIYYKRYCQNPDGFGDEIIIIGNTNMGEYDPAFPDTYESVNFQFHIARRVNGGAKIWVDGDYYAAGRTNQDSCAEMGVDLDRSGNWIEGSFYEQNCFATDHRPLRPVSQSARENLINAHVSDMINYAVAKIPENMHLAEIPFWERWDNSCGRSPGAVDTPPFWTPRSESSAREVAPPQAAAAQEAIQPDAVVAQRQSSGRRISASPLTSWQNVPW